MLRFLGLSVFIQSLQKNHTCGRCHNNLTRPKNQNSSRMKHHELVGQVTTFRAEISLPTGYSTARKTLLLDCMAHMISHF